MASAALAPGIVITTTDCPLSEPLNSACEVRDAYADSNDATAGSATEDVGSSSPFRELPASSSGPDPSAMPAANASRIAAIETR